MKCTWNDQSFHKRNEKRNGIKDHRLCKRKTFSTHARMKALMLPIKASKHHHQCSIAHQIHIALEAELDVLKAKLDAASSIPKRQEGSRSRQKARRPPSPRPSQKAQSGISPAGKKIFRNLGKNSVHFPFKNEINFRSKALASRLASLGLRNHRFRPAGAAKPAKKSGFPVPA